MRTDDDIHATAKAVQVWLHLRREEEWEPGKFGYRWSLATLYFTQGWPADERTKVFIAVMQQEPDVDESATELGKRFATRAEKYGDDGGLGRL